MSAPTGRSDARHGRPDARPARPRVLTIAGTDPTGGAGVAADLKTFTALGAYGMAVVTAVVAQNTHGVRSSHVPPLSVLRDQLAAVADDVTIDAVKIGMVGTREVADEVAAWLDAERPPLVVVDPVMVATSGHRLLAPDAEDAVRRLVTHADVVTPNLPELAVLVGEPEAATWPEALAQATSLAEHARVAVLVKGGHLAGGRSPDALVVAGPEGRVDVTELDAPRIATTATHGTGCTLSAAVAALAPRRPDLVEAARDAKEWLHGAIAAGEALRVGSGRGPVDHLHAAPGLGERRFTAEAWDAIADVRAACDDLPFVRALGDGSLDADEFAAYVRQDALYLAQYSTVLARAAQLAPTLEERAFFARGASSCLTIEAALHEDWLAAHGPRLDVPPSPETLAYTDALHRAAATGDYAVVVAAVLPCYSVYADVGARIARRLGECGTPEDAHPYGAWIATYSDPVFLAASDQARAYADRAAAYVSRATRARMLAAFVEAARHELAFFDQTSRRDLSAATRERVGSASGQR
ncbi:bifunctional hydroxymethylpyrimidine kinase/phosphomethylpyrimidine kinase [Cellulomonas alba]|uniref:Bifunctional hydroxymethylpyrimidine kinase/phosphomethylpyrimidine kinase n=1 Tax=Cellulomonas alba TaxID=3053467 RepID=A0ABT7SJ85_9CELL|nr:bifunctional hydroxymethylpyrimidine kinase/phosphomethylpyrimidine kinase [Cellulomonas alba]MDM7856238.1 bifunctional hydroxymethylpyrimidine kinase/phosphomethylpyrimidine kinase [Cellulomonas alba]